MIVKNILDDSVISALKNGQLIISKTDTIYGILAAANSEKAVEKLYEVKRRPLDKPVIILAADIDDIPDLTPSIKRKYQEISKNRPTTIITKVSPNFLPHLPRNGRTLAFRVVPESPLAELIRTVGLLVAPSANPSGEEPAKNITEAINYFHELVPIYVDSGETADAQPSQIIRINEGGEIEFLRR